MVISHTPFSPDLPVSFTVISFHILCFLELRSFVMPPGRVFRSDSRVYGIRLLRRTYSFVTVNIGLND